MHRQLVRCRQRGGRPLELQLYYGGSSSLDNGPIYDTKAIQGRANCALYRFKHVMQLRDEQWRLYLSGGARRVESASPGEDRDDPPRSGP